MSIITQFQYLPPLFFIVLSAFSILEGLPLAMNRIKPNHLYGVRVRKTLSNERIWYLANSYFGTRITLTGIISFVLAVVLNLMTMSAVTYGSICSIVFFGGLILTLAQTMIYLVKIS